MAGIIPAAFEMTTPEPAKKGVSPRRTRSPIPMTPILAIA